ncbi:MAG: Xaa-Pro peptidase family protein [Acidimicrobiales bacterium]|nr:Xaa-Pro peptidase family protein [Acidimicrobiales bacterium]
MHAERIRKVRDAMSEHGIDVLLLSVGADLPWLIGYEAMPLERLTMLVVPVDGDATLVVPRLEAPRVRERPELFSVHAWDETDDPIDLVVRLAGPVRVAAIGNRTWSQFLVELLARMPGTWFRAASEILGPLRARKDPDEVEALTTAAAAVDRVVAALHSGEIPLAGRSEVQVAADLGQRMLAEGHHRVNFVIVASGPNAASPHHEPSDRVIQQGDVVLFDFGGSVLTESGVGYCSDITRCVFMGEPPSEFRELYEVVHAAQQAAISAAKNGTPCEAVDAAARDLITAAGYGPYFIHRTGHGIGVEEHEDPYIVAGNQSRLEVGHAFSIEPGIYIPGRWGARLEDIVVVTDSGPRSLNAAEHRLVIVDA